MMDNKEAVFWPQLAEALAAKNLSSLRFDFSGNGDSEGQFRYGNIKQEVSDRINRRSLLIPAVVRRS